MRSRILLGLMAAVLLCTGLSSAEELYVRNRYFPSAQFSGGTAYVPVGDFIKALGMNWSVNGDGEITVSKDGTSPAAAFDEASFTLNHEGKSKSFTGVTRGGTALIGVKPLAEFLGYSVNYNPDSGIVDVVAGRNITDSDREAASELEKEKEAKRAAQKEAWAKRVAEHRERQEAKKAAEEAAAEDEDADGDDEDADMDEDKDKDGDEVIDEDVEEDGKDKKSKGDKKADKKKKSDDDADAEDDDKANQDKKSKKDDKAKSDEDEEAAANEDEDGDEPVEVAKKDDKAAKKDDKKDAKEDEKSNEPPPEANLVILSRDANPNFYTGEVEIKAVVENQGYAPAERVTGRLKVTGPDNRVWITKSVYGPNLRPDGRWEITETYKHRDGAAMPRGNFDIDLTLDFKTKS